MVMHKYGASDSWLATCTINKYKRQTLNKTTEKIYWSNSTKLCTNYSPAYAKYYLSLTTYAWTIESDLPILLTLFTVYQYLSWRLTSNLPRIQYQCTVIPLSVEETRILQLLLDTQQADLLSRTIKISTWVNRVTGIGKISYENRHHQCDITYAITSQKGDDATPTSYTCITRHSRKHPPSHQLLLVRSYTHDRSRAIINCYNTHRTQCVINRARNIFKWIWPRNVTGVRVRFTIVFLAKRI